MIRRNLAKVIILILSFSLLLNIGVLFPIKAKAQGNESQQVLVVYKNSQGKAEVLNNSQKVEKQFQNVPAVSVTMNQQEINHLKENPNVAYVEPNTRFKVSTTQLRPIKIRSVFASSASIPAEESQWDLQASKSPLAWEEGITGKGVKVAILDTGIASHPDLNISGGVSMVSYTNSYADDNGHGTNIAGIVSALKNGIGMVGMAPDVQLYAVKVLDNTGEGNLSDLLSGIDWAISNHMNLINLSLGASWDSQLLHDMVAKAYQNGVLVVCAAGNSGNAEGTGDNVSYPAKYAEAISVSAVDSNMARAPFSSTGSKIDFTAGGVDVVSTYLNGGYAMGSGTSQATPHVTGLLALLKQKYPTKTNDELVAILKSYAKDLGTTGKDTWFGNGFAQYQTDPLPPTQIPIEKPSISYISHVQDYGWMNAVSDEEMSGTVGQAKRLEAIKISIQNGQDLGVKYSTHVQDYGWLNDVSDGQVGGTTGQAKRIEAIKMELTGTQAANFDVYYRVHSQNFGWLGWAKNGEPAGTQGLSLRVEAIEIVLVDKGGAAPGSTVQPFIQKPPSVVYSTHVQDYGWIPFVTDGAMSGTTGQAKRIEAIKINLQGTRYTGDIIYSTHVQDYGWLNNVSDGQVSGITGQSKRVEAIKMNLTGDIANYYDIYYRVQIQDYGWLGWAKDGMNAGSNGLSKRMEAIEIKLVPKGQGEPVSETMAFKSAIR